MKQNKPRQSWAISVWEVHVEAVGLHQMSFPAGGNSVNPNNQAVFRSTAIRLDSGGLWSCMYVSAFRRQTGFGGCQAARAEPLNQSLKRSVCVCVCRWMDGPHSAPRSLFTITEALPKHMLRQNSRSTSAIEMELDWQSPHRRTQAYMYKRIPANK